MTEPELPFAITLGPGTSRADLTGSWRTERATYVTRQAPCGNACPAGEAVRDWLYDAEEGDAGYERAWRRIVEVNPFPAVMGRVCYHPCETSCNRGQLDESVGINSVERFLGDRALELGWPLPPVAAPSGRRVLVVGAGPAGLSAAYHLARLGHAVTVKEAEDRPGGMMRWGIPRYRLPRPVLDAEVQRILDLGVRLELGVRVDDLAATLAAEHFDAALVAIGAQIGKRAYIPAGSAAHVMDAVTVLHGLEAGERPLLGRRVAVYGGGNTAIDTARTARRLGAADALVVYRRTRDRMPAHESEVREAEEEGVRFRWLSTIGDVEEGAITVEQMELDDTGFPRPTGHTEVLAADSVVLALGQDSDLSLLAGLDQVDLRSGVVHTSPALMTGQPGVFAAGDVTTGERSVTVAIGHGRTAARHLDDWLSGLAPAPEPPAELAAFDMLNTWYYEDAPRSHRPRLELVRRQSTFEEVVEGLDADNALYEARRCMSCGTCFSCDNCVAVCPDNAVVSLGMPGSYAIDLDYCKGCGICVAECPCGAIEMVPEQI
ncbi:NAD(P)-binding protein [Nocardioides ganghwensis]|uniref:FAD-dependent oxidoreductase n=1 Tax=Nocardioides ganghwensis TaxID=252230 RepID=A0A4Q2SBW7_9ACTN|nr:NAD(P)-binding protein [Nocardioides ganghwensis]MBD3947117.1 NAD(P)-binding protein [Nocardioides ganghwensis]RYC02016.1 FAD-dependent oxidoreductase [Nocardioides ganghwensis]